MRNQFSNRISNKKKKKTIFDTPTRKMTCPSRMSSLSISRCKAVRSNADVRFSFMCEDKLTV